MYIYMRTYICWPSQQELQNILTASLQRGKTPPMNALNYLMVRLQ